MTAASTSTATAPMVAPLACAPQQPRRSRLGRWGLVAYARVWATIHQQPRTAHEAAAAVSSGAQPTARVLWRMASLGIAHVSSWCAPHAPRANVWVPRFAAGPGTHASPPAGKRIATGGRLRPRAEVTHFAAILRELEVGATRADITRNTGVMEHNLARLLRALRTMRLVRVAGWEVREWGGGRPAEVLQLGTGPDAPRPRRMSRTTINRRYKQARSAHLHMLRMVHHTAGRAGSEPDRRAAA